MEIDTLEGIQLGGIPQWIRVRGADAANPVLLLMQQGPGLPMINEARRLERLLHLEETFTVVYWDQEKRRCDSTTRCQLPANRWCGSRNQRTHPISRNLPSSGTCS
jgi:hypothetical protein